MAGIERTAYPRFRRTMREEELRARYQVTAEAELSVLSRQCLNRRIPDQQTLCQQVNVRQVNVWQADRNSLGHATDWRFTNSDTRIELNRLYPAI